MISLLFSLLFLFSTSKANALDAACTTTTNLGIARCPEDSTDWYESYTDTIDELDALARTAKSTFSVTGNAFSVGVSTFLVSAGNVRIGSGGTPIAILSTGTYTPTLTNTTNLDASTALATMFLRVGNLVHVFGNFQADPTTTLTGTVMQMSLPVASNFTAASDAGGTSNNSLAESGSCSANATDDTLQFDWVPASTNNRQYTFTCAYQIK